MPFVAGTLTSALVRFDLIPYNTFTDFAGLFFAALFGAVAALGGAFALSHFLPIGKSNSLAPLHARIAQLETELNKLHGANKSEEITRKVQALEAQLAETGKLEKGVTERLQGVEKTISDLALAAKGGDAELASIAAIAQRAGRVVAIRRLRGGDGRSVGRAG